MNYTKFKKSFSRNKTYQVIFPKNVPDPLLDAYIENEMYVNITNIDIDEDDVVIVSVDWAQFISHNTKFEGSGWYIPGTYQQATGTMKEAGIYPNSHKEDVFLMNEDDLIFQEIKIDSYEKAKKVYAKSNSVFTFEEWLSRKAGF